MNIYMYTRAHTHVHTSTHTHIHQIQEDVAPAIIGADQPGSKLELTIRRAANDPNVSNTSDSDTPHVEDINVTLIRADTALMAERRHMFELFTATKHRYACHIYMHTCIHAYIHTYIHT
jgi:hypothetical protein